MKRVVKLVRWALSLEKSTAGRTNIVGMILSLVASGLLSLTESFQSIVRVFQPHYTNDFPIVQVFAMFLLFNFLCVMLLVILEVKKS